MEISKGIEMHGLGLLIKKTKTLILGDLHFGHEEELHRNGILIPTNQFKDIMQETKQIVEETKPTLIILNGDVKHNFGLITRAEWKNITEYFSYLKSKANVILIKGNHDKILKPIADKTGIDLKDYHEENNTYITHGHEMPKDLNYQAAKTIIIGHEHPAIALKDGARVEKFKCFLKGKTGKKDIIIMPSLTRINEGTDVLTEKMMSPLLKDAKLKDFEVYIIEDKVYHFGTIRMLEKL